MVQIDTNVSLQVVGVLLQISLLIWQAVDVKPTVPLSIYTDTYIFKNTIPKKDFGTTPSSIFFHFVMCIQVIY